MGLASTRGAKKSLYRLQDCDRRQAVGFRVQAPGVEAARGGGYGEGKHERVGRSTDTPSVASHALGWLVHSQGDR